LQPSASSEKAVHVDVHEHVAVHDQDRAFIVAVDALVIVDDF